MTKPKKHQAFSISRFKDRVKSYPELTIEDRKKVEKRRRLEEIMENKQQENDIW